MDIQWRKVIKGRIEVLDQEPEKAWVLQIVSGAKLAEGLLLKAGFIKADLKSPQVYLLDRSKKQLLLYIADRRWNAFSENAIFACVRDAMGAVSKYVSEEPLIAVSDIREGDVAKAVIVGLEMALYTFKAVQSKKVSKATKVFFSWKVAKSTLDKALLLGCSLNLSRYLVDLPSNFLNPQSYAEIICTLFENSKNNSCSVTVWKDEELQKERMSLLYAVGAGAVHGSHMVKLSYRPAKSDQQKPIAFIGKGVCFDSGGLNIKVGGFMRLMKKDMGGSACVVGLAYYLTSIGYHKPVDFYLALAENAISAKAFRPGDILEARNGLSVEIDNTDAEGRLVMADVIALAVESKPEWIIDVATLTGATRVGLGLDIGGLYSNNCEAAQKLQSVALQVGDPLWHLPLYPAYARPLESSVADTQNSSSGMGGGIRAALFLEKFVGEVLWLHLDIYAFVDKPSGACTQKGGNGQGLQALVKYLDA